MCILSLSCTGLVEIERERDLNVNNGRHLMKIIVDLVLLSKDNTILLILCENMATLMILCVITKVFVSKNTSC